MLTAPSLPAYLAPGNGWPPAVGRMGDDRARFSSARKVQALAGTVPVPKESGNYRHAKRRTACLKPLRNALYQFAWQSTRTEAWAKDYYQRKRAQGKSHSGVVEYLGADCVRDVAGPPQLPACNL